MMEPSASATVESEGAENANIKIKAPKRVLHFCDGVIEEFSDDEVDNTPPNEMSAAVVDPKSLSWVPWFSYKAWAIGSGALAVCDYLGESLASFLGITTPKYWYEIEEFKRMQAEKEKEKQQAEGWSEPSSAGDVKLEPIQTNQPASSVA